MLSETEGTRYDFPFVSERRRASLAPDQEDLGTPEQELAPADRLRVWVEDLFVAGDGFDHDAEVIGSVAIAHGRGRDRVPFAAVFTFVDGDDVVVVRGDVPGDRNDWNGNGEAEVVDGTGRFGGKREPIPIQSRNPKRWG